MLGGGWGAAALAARRFAACAATTSSSAAADVEAVVVGAGVIGLAIARELACIAGKEVLVLEAGSGIGMETSSRNSEVIHAGIYYPPGSLKAKLCVEGEQLLYAFCQAHQVPHARLGKLLVATSEAQLPTLTALQETAAANGVTDLRWLQREQVAQLEPRVRCLAGLLSPSTGILDSHSFMTQLLRQAEEAGATLALRSRVMRGSLGSTVTTSIAAGGSTAGAAAQSSSLHQLVVRDEGSGEETVLSTRLLVNAAGLHAQALAASLAGLPPASIPRLYLAKGSYCSMATGQPPFRHLIYPMPEPGAAGLGVHLTLDMAGQARFGPDVEWLPEGTNPTQLDYSVDPGRVQRFEAAVRSYYPDLPEGSLQPAYSGVRPKLSGPGQPVADFCVHGPQHHGVPGLVNMYGIESPGLTASLALAHHAAQMLLASPP